VRAASPGGAGTAGTNGAPPPDAWAELYDYGVIGDLETAALVSRFGGIDWACLPTFSSPSVFGRLLDRRTGGSFRVEVDDPEESVQRYAPGTNVLETFLVTEAGTLTIRDFMPIPTVTPGGGGRIVRLLEVEGGPVDVRVEVDPRFDYGRRPAPDWEPIGPRRWAAVSGPDRLELGGPWRWSLSEGHLVANGRLGPEAPVAVEATWGDRPPLDDPISSLGATVRFWREWVHRPDAPIHRQAHVWHDWVERSELLLKLLSRGASGAFIASPTTSLPEWPGGARNWDYRYVWIRDAAFAAQVLLILGHLREARAYVRWVLARTESAGESRLRVLYDPDGGATPPERIHPTWEGYRGARPVRIGNEAVHQFQLDIFGEVLDAASQLAAIDPTSVEADFDRLVPLVGTVLDRWERPDSGLWEVRSPPAHFVHSKAMAWVAVDRGAALARRFGRSRLAARWRTEADRIRAAVLDRGYDPRVGAFTQAFGRDRLDASALRLPMVGLLPWTDDRVVGTVERVAAELADGPFVYRYRGDDGLAGPEGAFLLCSFWLVEGLARTGARDRALRNFRALLRVASPLRLFSEEWDPRGRRPLGNFPQAFTHIGLLRAALALGVEPRAGPAAGPTVGRTPRPTGSSPIPPPRRPVR